MLLIRDTVDRIDIERDLRKVVCADFAIVEIEHLSMKIVELTATESETVERAFYETKSYEMLLSVLSRQLNANANPETAKIIMHYAELCRAAQMKLKMAQDAVVAKYIDLDDSAFDRYLFDFSREEVRLFEKQTV